jgi:hypothetical protein
MSKTTVGVWAALDPPGITALADPDQAVGELVFAELAKSLPGRPHPSYEEMKHLFDPVIRASGVRTRTEFYRQAALVSVVRSGNEYTARRHKKVFKHDRVVAFGDAAAERSLVDPSGSQVGATVRELFELPAVDQVR